MRQRLFWPFDRLSRLGFVKLFGIDLSEAALPAEGFRSIEDIFTRGLRSGTRTIDGQYVSPADGTLVRSCAITGNTCLQIKGIDYSATALVASNDAATSAWVWASTVYLAPHNYHRVHAPFSGQLMNVRHISGTLWPVNEHFVAVVPQLFTQNERLVFDFMLAHGGRAAVVMVGAFNVGRMTTPFVADLITNAHFRRSKSPHFAQDYAMTVPPSISVGAEIGTFMLGSTVIILLDTQAVAQLIPQTQLAAVAVCMGQSLAGTGVIRT